jgi:hypothetical protein
MGGGVTPSPCAIKEEFIMAEAKKTTGEKLVTIKIPRVKKDQPDTFVSVNERTWQIKPGVEVQVPECVAEVLQHREEMLELIMEFEEQNAK